MSTFEYEPNGVRQRGGGRNTLYPPSTFCAELASATRRRASFRMLHPEGVPVPVSDRCGVHAQGIITKKCVWTSRARTAQKAPLRSTTSRTSRGRSSTSCPPGTTVISFEQLHTTSRNAPPSSSTCKAVKKKVRHTEGAATDQHPAQRTTRSAESTRNGFEMVDAALFVVCAPSANPFLLPLYGDLFFYTTARGRGGCRVATRGVESKRSDDRSRRA